MARVETGMSTKGLSFFEHATKKRDAFGLQGVWI
jgi:hypothetical protein